MQPPHPRPYDSQSASPYPRFHGPGPTSQPPPIPQHQPGAFRDAPTAPYPYNVSHSGPIPPSFQPYVRVNNSPSSTPNGLPPFPPPTSSPSHHNLPPPMPLPPISKKRKPEDDAVPPAPNYPPRLQGGPNYSYPLHHLPPPAHSGQAGVSAASPFTGSDSLPLPRGMMSDAPMQDSHKKAKFSPPSHSASTPRPPSPTSDAELNGLLLEIHKEMKDMKDANKDLWRAHASLKDDIKEFERLNFASSDISNASSSSSRSAYGPPFSSSTSAPSQHSQGPPPLPLASPSSYPHKPTPHHAPAPQQPQQPQPPSQPQSLKKLSPIPAQSLFQKFYTTLSQTQQPVQPLQPRLPSMSPQQPQPQQPQPQQPQQPPLHHSQPPQHAQTKQQPPPPRFAEFGRGEDLFQRFSARSAAMSTGSNGTETNPLHHGNLTSDGGRMMKDMHADREEARERERERERERDRERERGREREQREREHKEREAERYREQQQRNQRELMQQQQEQREQQQQQQRQREQSRSQDIFEMLGIANFGGEVAMGIAGVADSRYISVNEAFCRLFGYTQEELLGKSWRYLVHASDIPKSEASLSQCVSKKTSGPCTCSFQVRCVTKYGTFFNASTHHKIVFNEAGQPWRIINVVEPLEEPHGESLGSPTMPSTPNNNNDGGNYDGQPGTSGNAKAENTSGGPSLASSRGDATPIIPLPLSPVGRSSYMHYGSPQQQQQQSPPITSPPSSSQFSFPTPRQPPSSLGKQQAQQTPPPERYQSQPQPPLPQPRREPQLPLQRSTVEPQRETQQSGQESEKREHPEPPQQPQQSQQPQQQSRPVVSSDNVV